MQKKENRAPICFRRGQLTINRFAGKQKYCMISEADEISDFTDNRVVLIWKHDCIELLGKNLLIHTYESGTIEVLGEIQEIKFRKKGEKK